MYRDECGSSGDLLVFISPKVVDFVREDHETYRRIFTLINPYDFTIKYKVLSTNPHNVSVTEPEGTVATRSNRHILIKFESVRRFQMKPVERLRVLICKCKNEIIRGQCDVKIRFLDVASLSNDCKQLRSELSQELHECLKEGISSEKCNFLPPSINDERNGTNLSALMLCSFLLILLIIVLSLPTECPVALTESYFRVNHNTQLIAAFALGVISMIFALKILHSNQLVLC